MAFKSSAFNALNDQRGVYNSCGIGFRYGTSDTEATVLATGYFNKASVRSGDYIMVTIDDGSKTATARKTMLVTVTNDTSTAVVVKKINT